MNATRPDAFRILVLGDLGGRAARGADDQPTLASRRPRRVDRDDIEALFERSGVSLALGTPDDPQALPLATIDDLHPDTLFDSVSTFAELRALRRRLSNPKTFAAAAASLGIGPDDSTPKDPGPAGGSDSGSLLDASLAATADRRSAGGDATANELLDAVLRDLVIPHVTPAPDPRQAELVASVDEAIGAEIRRLLRSPAFRTLESTWRGLEFMVRHIETDARLSVDVLDITPDELRDDLADAATPGDSAVGRLLLADVPGATQWSLVVQLSADRRGIADAAELDAIARLATATGTAWILDADPTPAGHRQLADDLDDTTAGSPTAEALAAWQALGDAPAAGSLCLALPRFLLRLPYGARGGSVETFAFEELGDGATHENYAWGPAAALVACALAARFTAGGWQLDPRQVDLVDGLPADIRERDGEMLMQACAEHYLTDRTADLLAAAGLTVLRSVRGQDAIMVGPIHGLDGAALRGRWG